MLLLFAYLLSVLGSPPDVGMAVVQDEYALQSVAGWLQAALVQEGLEVSPLDVENFSERAPQYPMVIVPSIERFPKDWWPSLLDYLKQGGHLVALGGPPFSEPVWRWEGAWRTAREILETVRIQHRLIALEGEDLNRWRRAQSAEMGLEVELVSEPGIPGKMALAVHVPQFDGQGWVNLSRTLATPPPEGHNVLCFWAKGSKRTRTLVVELWEKDGSRWIATTPLTSAWELRTLPARAFRFWPDGSPPGRGKAGDRVRFGQVAGIRFGLATSHGTFPAGEHRFWIGDVGTAALGIDLAADPPVLEGFSPPYKVYTTEGAILQPSAWGLPALDLPPVRGQFRAVAAIWRPRALGPSRGSVPRWIPLIELRSETGEFRGAVASTYRPEAGSWTLIGLQGETLRAQLPFVIETIKALQRWFASPVYLRKAGVDRFSYFEDQTPALTAVVANSGDQPAQVLLQYRVRQGDRVVVEGSRRVHVEPHAATEISGRLSLPFAPGVYAIEVTLYAGGQIVDHLRHEFSLVETPADPPEAFVQVQDGEFVLGGKRWRPHGVNFWPRYVTGQEPKQYWAGWLHPSSYEPEVVAWDLRRLAAMGVNSVSIQYTAPEFAPALNDFLFRAKQHGIRANVYLDGCHPLYVRPERFLKLLKRARLGGNATVWAFDLAWEPVVGALPVRRRLDAAWDVWVVDQYGSRERALAFWNGVANRDAEGHLLGPTEEQILNDGSWRAMVAAYRRFLDDRISQGYLQVRQAIRQVAPYTLLGARTGYGGTGQPGPDARMPFDLISGAKHLDFISPEGWGLQGTWENFQAAGFTTAYARYAGNGKPVFWAEFGWTIVPPRTPEPLETQRRVYEHMIRLVRESGANGFAAWWYPGGLRVDEQSDFGILNPDGTPRPAFEVLRQEASRPLPEPRPPETWIVIDRDQHPRGYSAVWARHRQVYLKQVRAGRIVGIRTSLTGHTTETMPFIPVGGTREVSAGRPFPAKGLNAEWNWVEVSPDGQRWQRLSPGASLPWRGPLFLRASVGNTGEVTWIAGEGERSVVAVLRIGKTERRYAALPSPVARYEDAVIAFGQVLGAISQPTPLSLRMQVRPNFGFGLPFTAQLAPAP